MAESWQLLQPAILLGVGAAFDFHAGSVRARPQPCGLSVSNGYTDSYRNPDLWKRYLISNTLFLYYALQDALCGNNRK